MKLGVLGARADRRGLAIQTGEACRNLRPTRVLGVDMGDLSPYPNDWSDYDQDTLEVSHVSELHDDVVRRFLDGLDVVFGAETFYRAGVASIAREMGVRTVLQGNFEFLAHALDDPPDLLLSPSTWHFGDWPVGTMYLPFPVARDRLPFVHKSEAKTFLHVGGHRAWQDRAGTRTLQASLRYVKSDIRIIIRSQSSVSSWRRLGNSSVEVTPIHADLPHYWDIYAGADVLIHPRRYAGQSLTLNEAASCGMPVIALDRCPENEMLPEETLIPCRRAREFTTQSGKIGWYDASPRDLAVMIERLAEYPSLVSEMSTKSDELADRLSWETLGPKYSETFESLLSGSRVA